MDASNVPKTLSQSYYKIIEKTTLKYKKTQKIFSP